MVLKVIYYKCTKEISTLTGDGVAILKRCNKCGGIFNSSEVTFGLCKSCMIERQFEIANSINDKSPRCITTNEELSAYIKKWYGCAPVWIEYKSSKWIHRALLRDGNIDFDDTHYQMHYIRETIGSEWRAWNVEPTQEQRDYVEWLDKKQVVVTEPCPNCHTLARLCVCTSNNSYNPKVKYGYWFTGRVVCVNCEEKVIAPGVYNCEQDAKENAIRTWNRTQKCRRGA